MNAFGVVLNEAGWNVQQLGTEFHTQVQEPQNRISAFLSLLFAGTDQRVHESEGDAGHWEWAVRETFTQPRDPAILETTGKRNGIEAELCGVPDLFRHGVTRQHLQANRDIRNGHG